MSTHTYQTSHQRTLYRLAAGAAMAAGFLSLGLLPAEAASLTDMQAQLSRMQTQVATMQPSAKVLGASTTERIAPVHPSCRVNYDKKVYKVGDTMRVSYNTASADMVTVFIDGATHPDAVGGKIEGAEKSRTLEIPITTAGAAGVSVQVTSSTGHTNQCGRWVGVTDPVQNENPAYARVSIQIQNLMNRENNLVETLARVQASLAKVQADIAKLSNSLKDIPTIKTPKATSTAATGKYRLADVVGVSKVMGTTAGDVYTITLTSGAEKEVTVPSGATTTVRNKAFRDAGYTGNVKTLLETKIDSIITS